MPVGIAKCEKCGIEFKWKRSSGIPAKWCSTKCRKIRIDRLGICETCGKKYSWKEGKHTPFSRFCSKKCLYKKTGEWVTETKTFWSKASKEEKIERMKSLFERHVIRKEGCWDWNGVTHHSGYPPLKIGKLQTNAHIVSWVIHNGEIQENMLVCHKCDNKKCTNPDHLFLGTYKDNAVDRDLKNRGIQGEKAWASILKKEQVIDIKKLLTTGLSCTKIAKKYDVSPACIWTIKTGRSWKHIKDD